MEKQRNIAVIDLKAFYAYVECVDRGLDPWKTPLVVADKSRSVNTIVLSVTPYLKANGIPSRCRIKELPNKFKYIYATPRMARYIEKSSEVISIIYNFVAEEDVHIYSIDEAFIDITSYLNYYKMTPVELVSTIMKAINDQTSLQATAGIGDNFFLAKVALDIFAKKEKNGIAVMRKEDVQTKLWPITPLSKIWGIGPRLEARLNNLGIYNVKQLATSNRDFIKSKFGIMGEQLIDSANGIDEADIHEEYTPKEKSLSMGQVLIRDYNKVEIETIIREMVDDLSSRMRNENKTTSVVSLFIVYSKQSGGFGRQMSLLGPTDDSRILLSAILDILHTYVNDQPIRNVCINFGHLKPATYQQLNIFESTQKQIENHDLEKALDALHNKYGKNSVLRASSLLEESTTIERHNQIGGHRK